MQFTACGRDNIKPTGSLHKPIHNADSPRFFGTLGRFFILRRMPQICGKCLRLAAVIWISARHSAYRDCKKHNIAVCSACSKPAHLCAAGVFHRCVSLKRKKTTTRSASHHKGSPWQDRRSSQGRFTYKRGSSSKKMGSCSTAALSSCSLLMMLLTRVQVVFLPLKVRLLE